MATGCRKHLIKRTLRGRPQRWDGGLHTLCGLGSKNKQAREFLSKTFLLGSGSHLDGATAGYHPTAFQQARESLSGVVAVSLPCFNGPSRDSLSQHLVHRPALENPSWQKLPFLSLRCYYWPLLYHLGTAGDSELCKAKSLGWEACLCLPPGLLTAKSQDEA